MILIALVIGIVLVVAALRNTQGALFGALGTDVPGFVVWGAALFAIGALGYVPGLKPVSRGLLALVIIVIVMNNYQAVLAGFTAASQPQAPSSGGSTASASTSTPSTGQSVADSLLSVSDIGNSFGSVLAV